MNLSGSPPHDRLHELDGLRVLAITLVVLHHGVSSPIVAMLRASGQPLLAELIYETGASGVELFFVLSGIVLLRPYLRRERSFKPAVYAGRRIAASFWPWAAGRVAGFGVVRVPAPRYVTDP